MREEEQTTDEGDKWDIDMTIHLINSSMFIHSLPINYFLRVCQRSQRRHAIADLGFEISDLEFQIEVLGSNKIRDLRFRTPKVAHLA
jgi:hypothetical protein